MKKFFATILLLSLLTGLCGCGGGQPARPTATATPVPTETPAPTPEPTPEPTPTPEPAAEELTERLSVTTGTGEELPELLDRDCDTGRNVTGWDTVTVRSDTPMQGAYIVWERPPCAYAIEADGRTLEGGSYGSMQEYFAFDTPVTEFTMTFTDFSMLRDIRAFSPGVLPADVHVWAPPCEKADVCVFSAHSDDDVIFFGALIAQCVDRGLDVQVCYLCHHYGEQNRAQETLNGLWAMGVRNYPLIGRFPDYYVLSLEEAVKEFGREDVVGYVVECLRRFKPSVAVGHDVEGEYGHGAHMLFSEALTIACGLSGDGQYYSHSFNTYGEWDVPKVYLHLYGDAPMMLEAEAPLDNFGGMTAFGVATNAMQYHKSQLKYDHRPQLASEAFPRYDCRSFGLYRSLVGEDTGNDIMEHIPMP